MDYMFVCTAHNISFVGDCSRAPEHYARLARVVSMRFCAFVGKMLCSSPHFYSYLGVW